ncbi:MAG: ABC transporter permease, partial [Candidatus Latescibacterota bacterium]
MNGAADTKSLPVPGKAGGLKKILALSGPFLGLAFIILLFGALQPQKFLSAYNFMTVANQTVIVALAAMGMTFIIISGGIDLSVGSVIALNTVVTALLIQHGVDPFLALVAGVLSGMATGALSGLLIGGLGIVPFIATLGMMGIARGVAKWLAGEQKVDAPMTWLWQLMGNSDQLGWMLLPPGVWLMAIGSVIVAILLRYSLFGRYTFAIGSNESTARLCGIRVERMKFLIYTFAGLMT